MHPPIRRALAFGKNERAVASTDKIAGCLQCTANPRHFLRQPVNVEESSRKAVLESSPQNFFSGKSARVEKRSKLLLPRGRSETTPPARRERSENHRRVKMTYVIRREDHRRLEAGKVLQAGYRERDVMKKQRRHDYALERAAQQANGRRNRPERTASDGNAPGLLRAVEPRLQLFIRADSRERLLIQF